MASLTLKGIPEPLMERLRRLAEQERRSLNQQAIRLLEQSLMPKRPTFGEAYDTFIRERGPSPLHDDDLTNLRSSDQGRGVDL